jgi:hypothetical protein
MPNSRDIPRLGARSRQTETREQTVEESSLYSDSPSRPNLKVALAPFLRECAGVITLGIRAAMSDYSQKERDLLLHAERIFFPTPRFSMLFKALEKSTFPSATTYGYQRSRVIQQLLTESLGLAHPRTQRLLPIQSIW